MCDFNLGGDLVEEERDVSTRVRGWCFTLNNYTEQEELRLKLFDVDYLIFGYEIAPTTGTPHLQGYFYKESKISFRKIKLNFQTMRIAVAKGTAEQNKIYCSKSGNIFEKGVLPKQGKRNDLTLIKEVVDEGYNMRAILQMVTNVPQVKFAETYLKYYEQQRNWIMNVKWYCGASGTGKTQGAIREMGDGFYMVEDTKWFEGYDGHENVIFDELRPEDWKYSRLLRLLDSTPCRVETKGGSRQFLARNIIITSCVHPQDWPTTENNKQLLRRINEIKIFE